MSWYHEALAALAIFALIASWHLPRCRLWIGGLVVSFVISVAYYHATPIDGVWLPNGAAVAFFCDAILFLVIRETHKETWEIFGLGTVMIASATLNAIQMVGLVSGWPPMLSQVLYSSILEIANAAYLILIGGVGILGWVESGERTRRHIGPDRRSSVAMVVNTARKVCHQKTTVSQPLRKW